MGKADDVVQPEQACRSFDGMRGAEDGVDGFLGVLWVLDVFQLHQAGFHILQQLGAFDGEGKQRFLHFFI